MALVRLVSLVKTKSSADSISSLPAEPGREAVAILPSGLPVLKKKVTPACRGAGECARAERDCRKRRASHASIHPFNPKEWNEALLLRSGSCSPG